MKRICFLILFSLLILTSCFSKTSYITPIQEGTFYCEEIVSIENQEYTGIKLCISEITFEEFQQAKETNALQDYALSIKERKYYSCIFYFLQEESEILLPMNFVKKCNPYADGPDVYFLAIEIPYQEKILKCSASLHIRSYDKETPYALGIKSVEENLSLFFYFQKDKLA